MKKAIWMIAVIAVVLTGLALPFLPETVPVHFNAAWEPDRWGSRLELLLLPAVLLLASALCMLILKAFEKKAEGAEDEKERAGARTNVKALGIMAVALNAVLTLVQAWLLYQVHRAAFGGDMSSAAMDRLPFIFIGILFIVLGNIMPKTRRNGFIGFRVSWSMYNDETWRRTHRFGGYVMVVTGILLVPAAALVSPPLAATAVLLVLVTAAILITLGYARKVYREEKEREG